MLDMFVQHIGKDHGIEFDTADDGDVFFEQSAFRVDFGLRPDGLSVRLSGPNETAISFLKEEVVEHVSEVDPKAAADIRWSGGRVDEGSHPENFRELTVLKSFEVFAGMQRVTLSFPGLDKVEGEGPHLRLLMPLERGRPPVWPVMAANGSPVWPDGKDKLHARFVTIREARQEHSEIDIDIVIHAGGLISDWATGAEPGSKVGAMGPAGMTSLPHAQRYLIAADGTGLPAVAQLLKRVGDQRDGDVIVAFPSSEVAAEYLPRTGLSVHVMDPAEFERELVPLVKEITDERVPDFAFFAGEFQNAQELRKHFKTVLGLDKTSQLSTAFWRRGTAGFGS
ncbi:MAG: siderophore-interacting protein [Paracoccaceae bacterium]